MTNTEDRIKYLCVVRETKRIQKCFLYVDMLYYIYRTTLYEFADTMNGTFSVYTGTKCIVITSDR